MGCFVNGSFTVNIKQLPPPAPPYTGGVRGGSLLASSHKCVYKWRDAGEDETKAGPDDDIENSEQGIEDDHEGKEQGDDSRYEYPSPSSDF